MEDSHKTSFLRPHDRVVKFDVTGKMKRFMKLLKGFKVSSIMARKFKLFEFSIFIDKLHK